MFEDLDIDFDKMDLRNSNRQPSYKELQADLRTYIEMQDNLNANLIEFPAILDYLETLQCNVIPPDAVAIPFELEEKYRDKYYKLKAENKMLKTHIGLQHTRLGEDAVNLNAYALKLAACTVKTEDYRDNANSWREAYYQKQLVGDPDKALTRAEWEDTYHKFWVEQEAFFKLKK